MPYRYLENVTTADVAFEAWGKDPEELFISAAEAVVNVMISDLSQIEPKRKIEISLRNPQLDILLINWIQEIIYYKDAQDLLLRPNRLTIQRNGEYTLTAELQGEEIDPQKHDLLTDVKSATFHKFKLELEGETWWARVILDV